MTMDRPQLSRIEAGLCASCKYLKVVENERGRSFILCLLSKTDSSYARYPPLPVLNCPGYLPAKRIPG